MAATMTLINVKLMFNTVTYLWKISGQFLLGSL
jgi:hypothetical protein